ncbi:MAG: helicase-exonuclease AddAB subunit AddB [Syntrophomonadaceae bacterium]|jgi:ATP-dependent helicase/nuclease subunit B
MAFRFIIGRAGSGKSQYIYNEIKRHILDKNNCKHLLLLVPEQYTLQAERDFLDKTKLKGMMQLEVLSFTRLAKKILNEVGGSTQITISELGKKMVLRRILNELEGDLIVYKNSYRQRGFINELLKLIANLKQRAVTYQDLELLQKEIEVNSLIYGKLHDLTIIFKKFNIYLQDHYLDSEDYINLFLERLPSSRYLSDCQIWVDNFVTFSPQSIRILQNIMTVCPEITISLTLSNEKNQRDEDLFMLSRRYYKVLNEWANNLGITTKTIAVDATKARRYIPPELVHLENELFAYPGRNYNRTVSCLSIFAATNPDNEVEDMATKLISLVRDEGYRWREIAVICNDLARYGELIKRTFWEYGIPYFMDKKKEIMHNPIIEFIIASLQSVYRNYHYEDIFRYLKTGLGPLNYDACEKLENYVLENGVRGNKWKEVFSRGKEEYLEELNYYRQEVILPLEKLKNALSFEKNFSGYTRVIYDYLESMEVQVKLQQWIDEMRVQELYEIEHEYSQIWNIVIETFDQMIEFLGDQQGSLKEYIDILEAGFSSHELGLIPSTVDQVLVGNIKRSKCHNIKALFVLGINDGIIPAVNSQEGVLSSDETDYLANKGVELAPNRQMRVIEESFLIYCTLSKSQQKLFLSYSNADNEGRALRPSLLINRICYLFPAISITSGLVNTSEKQLQLVSRPQSTFKHLIENLQLYLEKKPVQDFWWDVYNWYFQQSEWQERCNQILRAFNHCNQIDTIGLDLARRLYNLPLKASVTRLEKFIACPFAHFIHYGLSPKERKEFSVKAPDIGELFHNSLLALAEEIEKKPEKWQGLKQDECNSLMDMIMDKIFALQKDGVFFSNNRNAYLSQRLKRIGRRAAWIITQHIKKGEFTPWRYEIRFGSGQELPALLIELENGEILKLEGRIDRVDILDQESSCYIRIIDYKTGDKRIRLSDFYYGLNLQLLVYLKAVLASSQIAGHKDLKPGGIFYFKIEDPLIKTVDKAKEVIEQKLNKELKLKGLVLKDLNVVQNMDRQINSSSEIIPVGLKQDNTFNSNSSVISEEDFSYLLRHIDYLLKKVCYEMFGGKVKIEPYKVNNQTACDYCSYRSICLFDPYLSDNSYRNLQPLKDTEAIRKIRLEQGEFVDELDSSPEKRN